MPIVTVQYRSPRSGEQLAAASARIIDAIAEEWQMAPDLVQVFLEPYDDDHWHRGRSRSATD